MAKDGPGGEKTEKPTGKRLSEARRNGDVLQSRELSTALVTMGCVAWLAFTGPDFVGAIQEMLAQGLQFSNADIVNFAPEQRAWHLISAIMVPLCTLMLMSAAASIAAPMLLGSFGFRPGALAFKPQKLDPIKGFFRLFGMHGLIELVKSIAKIILMGAVGGVLLWQRIDAINVMGKSGVQEAIASLGAMLIFIALVLSAMLFLIAAVDVPVQAKRRMDRLKMSRQEIRDEHKDADSSPLMKRAIRRRMGEILGASMQRGVEEAAVVLTNPTHFAVALRYHPGRDHAPIVVARGADEIAAAIRELANEKSVPILQYPELTRAIFFTSRMGEPIDERLFLAAATILAFVFRIENRMASEMDRPYIELPDELKFDSDGRKIVN
jgi:flagellar biosynthesis protein FlhB